MSMVDARGLSCPIPVLMVREELKKNHPDTLEVLLDQDTARENVTRLAWSMEYQVTVQTLEDGEYCLILRK